MFNRLLYAIHFRHYCRLLDGILPRGPRILELGAGSGVIARRIVRRWGGHAILVDSNSFARLIFLAGRKSGEPVSYVAADVLALDLPPVFDLVYSDGLIEHFREKTAILNAHRRALKPGGYLMLFVPKNSLFFRTLTRFGPDLGYEERYTASTLAELCRTHHLQIVRQTDYFFAVGVLCQSGSVA